jgi:hypothetical protein
MSLKTIEEIARDRERERETKRDRERGRERQREGERRRERGCGRSSLECVGGCLKGHITTFVH